MRADVLAARLTGASRSIVAEAARCGALTVNGSVVKGSAAVRAGDELACALAERPGTISATPEAIPLRILHEDDAVIVVDKPAGMVTHPAHGSPSGTLVNALLAHVGAEHALPGEPLRAGLVHRLDRDTSGLLVVAKTPEALATLGKAMQRRRITREYLGLVTGIPPDDEAVLSGPIGRDPQHRMRFAVRPDGKPAVTHLRVRERLRGAAECAFRLETGRTHQIRVHLAAYGHPIVNDPLYGGRKDPRFKLPGQALHAWRLEFRHPTTREPMRFEAEPPLAYREARELLRS